MELNQLILQYKNGDKDSFLRILDKFKFTIKKIARNLNYDDAESDLILYLLEITNSITLDNLKLKSDGALVNYIYLSLKNKSTKLYKTNFKIINESICLDESIKLDNQYSTNYDIELYSSLSCLNDIEKKVIINRYINNLTYKEIACKLGVSRQSVYKNKTKSLKKLKKYII